MYCGYTFEPPRRGVQTSTHNVCFGSKIRKLGIPLQPQFFYIKVEFKGVYIAWTCFSDENRKEIETIIFLTVDLPIYILRTQGRAIVIYLFSDFIFVLISEVSVILINCDSS